MRVARLSLLVMSDTSKSMPMSHLGRRILNVVPMLLVFSLGFVMGMISDSNFPNFYISFVPPMPSPALPLSLLPVSSPSPPLQPVPPPPSLQLQVAEVMCFLVPKSAIHYMTDEELFSWASMAPKVRSMPYHRVPKVAFLFLTRGNLPLWPLWEMFFNGHDGLYSIYVHTDPSYTGLLPEESVFYGRIIPSQKTMWGDVTLEAVERRLLANALLDLNNERFVLLSESCIPLYDFPTVHAVLTGSNTSFVDSFVNHNSEVRYNPFFADRSNITLAQWRKGSQWFEMDRALALEVVSNDTYFLAFREYCTAQSACLMDEHYIPTLLSLIGWRHKANQTLTYVDWRMGGVHPRTYGRDDVTDDLIRKIRGGAGRGRNCTYNDGASGTCYLFARKFAHDALELLFRLAPKVMGFG